MKTQINNLINGEKRTIRAEHSEKYATAKKATSHIGYAGTSREEREAVAIKVASENEDVMVVEILGKVIRLTRQYSTSGKTWWWSSEISEAFASNFVNTDGIMKSYTLTIRMDCTADITKNVRKNERQQWKFSMLQPIDESFITILEEEDEDE